ncbi:type 4a pilus biogenesis protein PilO [Actinoplanes friuliensis]|jgi:Tfp pilus assembly protein PilO|uniref:Type IV pilus assembly protein PilO n=1 Tax=Actinoplanes friuliensis DSM 7358 TaxID=1246995 RepID=U5VV00_9ACTN|nr:type 4a pilus biogenesis protein PilO [Actinoplanes friuliensis]AGZ39481.1 hypothetical protein AFR_05960 [Actinoplanes friuliensis DSM 7358]
MGARHADRLWMFAGALVILLLAAVSWFVLISPQYAEAEEIRSQTGTSQDQIVGLNKTIAQLKKDQAKLKALRATLATNQEALPEDSGVPDFLRQLQSSGDKINVNVSGVTVSTPVQVEGTARVWALPITLTADGTPANLGLFLDELQSGQARAVLIDSANLAPNTTESDADSGGNEPESMSLNLTVKAFVAPPAGAGAPTVTTDD